MRKPLAARYRTTNWSACNAALWKRGSLLIWLDKEMISASPRETQTPSRVLLRNTLSGSGQTAEIHIRIALMNRFSVFGIAEIVPVV